MNLIQGDCLEELKKLDDNSIDLCILDLPYGQTDCDWDIKIDLSKLWEQLKRVGKPNTPYFFFTTTKFGYELIKANEKWFRYDLVWSKPNSSAGFLNSKKMPMRAHEMIYVFYNKLPFYDIQNNHIKLDVKNQKEYVSSSLYTTNLKILQKGQSWQPKLPKSVLQYDIQTCSKKKLHQTEKPIQLLEWIIKYFSKEGDTILDPTMGSGSIGEACKNLKRNFIGIEMNKDIYDVAVKRLMTDN
jgi:DNA modification methylase